MTFRAWLAARESRDTPLGDLARDVRRDRRLRGRDDLAPEDLVGHVRCSGGCREAVRAAESAVRLYQRQHGHGARPDNDHRSWGEPARLCAHCGHLERLHARVGSWCAHPDCARPCEFEASRG